MARYMAKPYGTISRGLPLRFRKYGTSSNVTRPTTTNRWGNRRGSTLKKFVELKKQALEVDLVVGDGLNYETTQLSRVFAQQGTSATEVVGQKVFQKYHSVKCHMEYARSETDVDPISSSIRCRVVIAWRQNKTNGTYDPMVGLFENQKGSLINGATKPTYMFMDSYIEGNDGTYHVVFDKMFTFNVYTRDSASFNIFFDKNRPINLEPQPSTTPTIYADTNRTFFMTVITDRTMPAGTQLSCTIRSEVGFYDP